MEPMRDNRMLLQRSRTDLRYDKGESRMRKSRKMIKRKITAVLLLAMVLSTGCGKKNKAFAQNDPTEPETNSVNEDTDFHTEQETVTEDAADSDYENSLSLYSPIIEEMESEFGAFEIDVNKIEEYEDGYCVEANGLCYLELIDFDNDGIQELLAAAKHKNDKEYTVFVYSLENGKAEKLIESDELMNNYLNHYRDLRIITNNDQKSFIDGGCSLDEWSYYEIYGMKSDHTFGLISASCDREEYNQNTDTYEIEYYVFSEPPYRLNWVDAENSIVSEEQYKEIIDEWIYTRQYEGRSWITFMDTIYELGLKNGGYCAVNGDLLKESVEKVKKMVEYNHNNADHGSDGIDEEITDEWKQSYLEYIQEDQDFIEETTYDFCYIDNDRIPEIVISYGVEASGTRIISYQNGEVIEVNLSRLGGLQYIEKQGLLYNSTMIMGVISDEVYRLDDGRFTRLGFGERTLMDDHGNEFTYRWEDQDVNEKEYLEHIEALFDSEKAIKEDVELPFFKGEVYFKLISSTWTDDAVSKTYVK